MKNKFKLEKYYDSDKTIRIYEETEDGDGWGALIINIDYDDVDHPVIERKVKKLLKILNKHWDDKNDQPTV